MVVAKDGSEAVVSYFRQYARPNCGFVSLNLAGLDENASYEEMETGDVFGGDELMYIGLNAPFMEGDYAAALWRLRRL